MDVVDNGLWTQKESRYTDKRRHFGIFTRKLNDLSALLHSQRAKQRACRKWTRLRNRATNGSEGFASAGCELVRKARQPGFKLISAEEGQQLVHRVPQSFSMRLQR